MDQSNPRQFAPQTRCLSAFFGIFYEKDSLTLTTTIRRNSTLKGMKRYENDAASNDPKCNNSYNQLNTTMMTMKSVKQSRQQKTTGLHKMHYNVVLKILYLTAKLEPSIDTQQEKQKGNKVMWSV